MYKYERRKMMNTIERRKGKTKVYALKKTTDPKRAIEKQREKKKEREKYKESDRESERDEKKKKEITVN